MSDGCGNGVGALGLGVGLASLCGSFDAAGLGDAGFITGVTDGEGMTTGAGLAVATGVARGTGAAACAGEGEGVETGV